MNDNQDEDHHDNDDEDEDEDVPDVDNETHALLLNEALLILRESRTTALSIDDGIVSFIREIGDPTIKMTAMNKLCQDLLLAIQGCQRITRVFLGTIVLQLLNAEQQMQLYELLIANHASIITHWKLGSHDSVELCGIPTSNLLLALRDAEWPALTEFQVQGMELSSQWQVDMLVDILTKTAPTIRLFNLLGLVLSMEFMSVNGLFDPLVTRVETISQLDEVQLHRLISVNDPLNIPPLVSHRDLQHLLEVKPAWERMALNGMRLDDGHLQILGNALKHIPDCKMNDFLSVRDNPKITSIGLSSLYTVCVNKQRMGRVHSDDPSWTATLDLVRPLNNLYRRLEYKDADGQFTDPQRWLEWLRRLSTLGIDETIKLNYIWFTLSEQPEMIQSAISFCSHNND